MLVFRKIWRALFSCYLRFKTHYFVLSPTNWSLRGLWGYVIAYAILCMYILMNWTSETMLNYHVTSGTYLYFVIFFVSDIVLVSLSLTLSRFYTLLWCFHFWLWTSDCCLGRLSSNGLFYFDWALRCWFFFINVACFFCNNTMSSKENLFT